MIENEKGARVSNTKEKTGEIYSYHHYLMSLGHVRFFGMEGDSKSVDDDTSGALTPAPRWHQKQTGEKKLDRKNQNRLDREHKKYHREATAATIRTPPMWYITQYTIHHTPYTIHP
jgi:hypothetical protein